MPTWINEVIAVVQLLLNVIVVVGGGIIWRLYTANLQATLKVKDAAVESAEKGRDFWRDKALDLEKRSPEVLEKVLSDRIHIRDGEIERLRADREFDSIAMRTLEIDKGNLEQDLFRTQGFRAMLALEELDYADESDAEGDGDQAVDDEDDLLQQPSSIEVELIGAVAVDSGQLMVTDPCYVDAEWRREPYAIEGEVERDEETLFNYSYDGACRSTLGGEGHGELAFTKGHAGAGVAFATAWGDGMYPVYAEKHDGRIVRVYVNVG